MEKMRNNAYDIISGAMIIWMVVYHAFQWGGLTNTDVFKALIGLFFFFMPWFFLNLVLFLRLNHWVRQSEVICSD